MPRSTAVRLTPVFAMPPPLPPPPSPTKVAPPPSTPSTPPSPPPRGAALNHVDEATQTRRVLYIPRLLRRAPPLALRMPLTGLARSAEEACRAVDDSARLAFVSHLQERTMLRVRTSGARPLDELKALLAVRFPLARVRTYADCLDGTAGAELELPGEDEALLLARGRVRARPLLRALRSLSHLCLIMAVLAYFRKVFA